MKDSFQDVRKRCCTLVVNALNRLSTGTVHVLGSFGHLLFLIKPFPCNKLQVLPRAHTVQILRKSCTQHSFCCLELCTFAMTKKIVEFSTKFSVYFQT